MPQAPVISIIDDDISVRLATQRLVRSLGYSAHTFDSAAEFLGSRHCNDTSCLITDVQMPGMSGIKLQTLLLQRSQGVPLIFNTAFPDDKVRAQAMKRGAICFLAKPFHGKLLVDCIETALKG